MKNTQKRNTSDAQVPMPLERIEKAILLIRGHKVMLDADLAALYGVKTVMLIRAVRRNIERFPDDFMFRLTNKEVIILRSQFGISSQWGRRRHLLSGSAGDVPKGCA